MIKISLRNIRPASGDGSASGSNPPPSSTSENTGTDPRRNRDDNREGGGEGNSTASKRRRVPESVTRNACLNCKKARAKVRSDYSLSTRLEPVLAQPCARSPPRGKVGFSFTDRPQCDGQKPCKRCATRVETAECIYEVHIKHAKEELVKQIKELKAKDHLTERILNALIEESEKVLEIVERLQNRERYESIVEWLGHSTIEDLDSTSPRTSHHSTTFEASDHEMGGMTLSTKWTSVKCDDAVFNHLFSLYFAWVHPVHTLFDEGYFSDNYKRHLSDYCSDSLVNAICAMACHLCNVDSAPGAEEQDFEQLGEFFSDAAIANLDPKEHSITNAQTFAVMFLVDCARSKGLRAASYLREATSALPTLDFARYRRVEGFEQVWKHTVRGIRNLNV
jgi:hypothetical protein